MARIANAVNASIQGLQNLNTTTGQWTGRTLTSTGGTISITNGDGTAGNPNLEVNGSSVGQTITGDVGGPISPSSGNWNIISNVASNNSGATVEFSGSSSTLTLNVSDGIGNTLLGFHCGNATRTGEYNCGFGGNALFENQSGVYNNAFGYYTLHNCTGSSNNCYGYNSGIAITSGSNNSAFGHLSLGTSQTSAYNCAFGYNSMVVYANGGGYNSSYGQASLGQLTTGSYNIAIGTQAGNNYTSSESNNICIGNAGTSSESNVIRIGTQGNSTGEQNLTYIAGITGASPVSGNTPQVVLCDNAGNLTAISSSTAGHVLTSNGTATPSFQAAGGGGFASCFSVAITAVGSSVTGDGTVYPILFDTTLFDKNSNITLNSSGKTIFTAPATGIYDFSYFINVFGAGGGALTSTYGIVFIVTPSLQYVGGYLNPSTAQVTPGPYITYAWSGLVAMTAGDTAYLEILLSGGTKNAQLYGQSGGNIITGWSGHQVY